MRVRAPLLRPWQARCPGRRVALVGLVVGGAALASPAAALASPSVTLAGKVDLGADALPFYDTFTVASTGVVTVKAYQPGSTTDTGWLTIKANTIHVEAGGIITADGAGFQGQDGKYGNCALMTPALCAGAGTMVGSPGGGGGYFAGGADGALEATMGTCTDAMSQAPGGAVFFMLAKKLLDLGSAGGAANTGSPTATAGSSGGGGVRLLAAVVTIDGTVSAGGINANPFGGVGPGGGSGGAIEITAGSLTGAGTLSVKGGNGAHGIGIAGSFPPNNGGGGSGGVVLLHLPPGATSPVTVAAGGGTTGDCNTFGGPPGGSLPDPLAGACPDVDGDGHPSVQCGGDDCDDSDPAVHPGAMEICNGKDDNCDGHTDEAPNDCTAKGEVCGMAGGLPACVAGASDAGVSDGGDAPQYIQYGGGCRVPEGAPSRGGAALSLGIAALALAARRRRRSG